MLLDYSFISVFTTYATANALEVSWFAYITACVVLYELVQIVGILYFERNLKLVVDMIDFVTRHCRDPRPAPTDEAPERVAYNFDEHPELMRYIDECRKQFERHVLILVFLMALCVQIALLYPKLVWQLHVVAIAFMYDWW